MTCIQCGKYWKVCDLCDRCYDCIMDFWPHKEHQDANDVLLMIDNKICLASIEKIIDKFWPDRLKINTIKEIRSLFYDKKLDISLREAVAITEKGWKLRS